MINTVNSNLNMKSIFSSQDNFFHKITGVIKQKILKNKILLKLMIIDNYYFNAIIETIITNFEVEY